MQKKILIPLCAMAALIVMLYVLKPDDDVQNRIFFAVGIACMGAFFYYIAKEPRRITCGIFLVLAIYFIINNGLQVFMPNEKHPDGSVSLGGGSEITFSIMIIFIPVSIICGILLCVNGAQLRRREARNLTNILPTAFGVTAIAWPFLFAATIIFVSDIDPMFFTVLTLVVMILLYIPIMLAAFLLHSFVYAALRKPKGCDFVIVLGAGLKKDGTVTPLLAGRLDRAIRYHRSSGGKTSFVVSGGRGADEKVSEAYAMKEYLLSQGIPESKIIMEDRSTNTHENLCFAKELMAREKDNYRCIISTSNYHVLRAVIIANAIGLAAQGIGSKTKFYYLPAAFFREYIAIIFSYKGLLALYVIAAILYTFLG